MNSKALRIVFLACLSLSGLSLVQAQSAKTTQAAPLHPLIYGREEMFGFDVEDYLSSKAPALLPYAEAISHWAGYSSISPRVLLALIEQQTGLLSRPQQSRAALVRPMGELSSALGFSEQVRDVADQLARALYPASSEAGSREFKGGDLAPVSALAGLLARSSSAMQARAQERTDTVEQDFALVYQGLFGHRFDVDAARMPLSALQPAGTLRRTMGVQSLGAASSYLQFPFPVGQSWYVGGAHTNTGSGTYPMSSLDMYKSGGWGSNQSANWVVASAGGTFKKHSSCFAEVVHTDGWSTTYYHLQNLRYNTGAYVAKNVGIGNPASNQAQALCNGGQSTGPHLHFSLKYNGGWMHLAGYALSSWVITANGVNYDTNCSTFYMTRNGVKRCAGLMYND
ncbi:M23 family metallopeptidase [Paucibacter sp. B51]|uniref:M23 family metallopeptidase n=1 Tax=Paucibacter sp. B51 TaxID=2993315 RepID=UPI0022EBE6F4|nr:M23 family metallopeptidase [Paucibacter sp. B51]